jgi:hypothetical protein
MSARIASLSAVLLLALFWPAPAAACGCGGTISTLAAVGRADVVFVGTVSRIDSPPAPIARHNVDGSISADSSAAGPDFVLFDVARVFKRPPVPETVAANTTQKFTTTTERWGPLELVVPPGDFEVWVERSQTIVAPKRVVHVKNGAEVKLRLLVEYSGADR